MYFKKLELIGFKSFMEKTTLHFEPGITAIVGPNGCGKSNIFDSIRWVLGEQSIKALRGSCMEDVIFNGTDSKESLSMAEVNLTFDNEKRFFPVDHNEVVISRRVFRSGESEYLLNKAPVRLKDVSDLLMGTGIGAESYSLVEQGKIDLILSARAEDRRLVFDEAAGITKYKSQKKEALRKLEETEQNLLRINDIIAEVKRQIGSLERQASKARKYKEVFEELKSKEITLSILQKGRLMEQKGQIISSLSQLQAREAEFLDLIKAQESQINLRNGELKNLEDNITGIKNRILNLDNLIIRNKEHAGLNQERIAELDSTKKYLEGQLQQLKNKISLDEEKMGKSKEEYLGLKKDIAEKTRLLKEKEGERDRLQADIKISLENIATAKNKILDLVNQTAHVKNDIGDLASKQQIYLARLRRLEVEKAKVKEEASVAEDNLKDITQEIEGLKKNFEGLNLQISDFKKELEQNNSSLAQTNNELEDLEKQKLALESHREFLDKLKTKYEDISQSLNAVIYLDKLPEEKLSGLVVKVKDFESAELKLKGEAKPIDLDTQKIDEKINRIQENIGALKNTKAAQEAKINDLQKVIAGIQETSREQEIILVNKAASRQSIFEQFNKIKEEEGIIDIELSDIKNELSVLEEKLSGAKLHLSGLDKEQKRVDELISREQNNISENSALKEEVLVQIAREKTQLEAINKRIIYDEADFKILEDACQNDKAGLLNLQMQITDIKAKQEALETEIKDLTNGIEEGKFSLQTQKGALVETEDKYAQTSKETDEVFKKIKSDRKELDALKNRLYELQMQNKDVDFKYLGIKERISQAYKIDLDEAGDVLSAVLQEENDENLLSQVIQKLKEKLDSYGSVNLIAIEEYDELKKRYDFLNQQQNDLLCAKESLHEAILKINRTTKKMFLDTFGKIQLEFRNYFKLLFNGGDAQIFLIDEQDPLESGIEIICRPPGKKLQNVLLLSGGEKSLSAIALIFAIFKVKPAPFCVLDEIDAALDEANVERFSRILQEFIKESQFIIITHNKRTIANANVMYGITMEESGVSKIVSVKFAQNGIAQDQDKNKELVAEAV